MRHQDRISTHFRTALLLNIVGEIQSLSQNCFDVPNNQNHLPLNALKIFATKNELSFKSLSLFFLFPRLTIFLIGLEKVLVKINCLVAMFGTSLVSGTY